MTFRQAVGRLSAIALAGVVATGLAVFWANRLGPARFPTTFPVEARHRPARPEWKAGAKFLAQFLILGGIALAGRKLLRIRLRR